MPRISHLCCFFPGFGVFRDEVDAGARLVQLLRAIGVVVWRRRRRRNGRMVGRAADAVGDPARAARAAVDDEVRAAARRRPLLQTNGTSSLLVLGLTEVQSHLGKKS